MSEIGEKPYVERVVVPGEIFYPFDPEHVIPGVPLATTISLRTSPIPPMDVMITAHPGQVIMVWILLHFRLT